MPEEAHAWSKYHRALHWSVAVCVIALVPVGLLIDGYERETVQAVDRALGKGAFNTIYDLHKSVGLTVLALMALRVISRATKPAPTYAKPLKPFEKMVSGLVHGSMYLLLLVVPIVGWIGVSAYPAPAPVFFLFDAKLPIEADRALSERLLSDVHGPLGILLAILALAHLGAALKHRMEKDGVWERMVPPREASDAAEAAEAD
ncbi:MAG: cytochrome b/b6 domain-containing protein [Pseudomonadota bacterium]